MSDTATPSATELNGLTIVERASTISIDGKSKVIVRSPGRTPNDISALRGESAHTLAKRYAISRGISNPMFNERDYAPYPVDRNGNTVVNQMKQPVDHYRVDFAFVPGGAV